jgi:hypothetical protein
MPRAPPVISATLPSTLPTKISLYLQVAGLSRP